MKTKNSWRPRFYYGYIMVFLGFMIMAIVFVLKYTVAAEIVKPVCDDLGCSRTEYTLRNTVMAVTMMLSCAVMGKLMSKYKQKYVVSICLFVLGLSYLALSRINSLWQLYLISAIQGFAFGGATTLPVNIFISNWFGPKAKGTFLSIALLGSGVGSLVLVNVFQRIIDNWGWRSSQIIIGIVFLVVMVPLVFFLAVNTPAELGYKRRVGDYTEPENSGRSKMQVGISAKDALKTPRFYVQLIGEILLVACASGFDLNCVAYLTDSGWNNTKAAAFFASAFGSLVIGKIIVGFISDRITVRWTSLVTPLFFSVTFIALNRCTSNSNWSQVVIWTYMIGGSIATVIPPLLTANNYGDKEFGTIQGFITMGGNIGQMIGPLIGSVIFDLSGSYGASWIIYAVMMVIVGGLFFISTLISEPKIKMLEKTN